MIDYNPDSYWTVNGQKYHRKMDAIIASSENNNSKIEFYYYNKEFEAFDWTVEPTESFEELARQRAHQLRDNNKHLRLWYSGGSDSHTMLQAFLQNNIFLDEIVTVRSSARDDLNSPENIESNHRSIPYLNSIRADIPRTKITVIDMQASDFLEYYKIEEWAANVVHHEFLNDPDTIIHSIALIEKYGKLKTRPGTIEISGADKAKIIRHEGKYYIPMVDSGFNYAHLRNVKEFFTTAELPELHSKQCFELMHILNKIHGTEKNITHEIYNPLTIDPMFKHLWYNNCRQIINPEADYGKGWGLNSPKSNSRIIEAKKHNPELIKYYFGSIRETQPMFGDYWKSLDDIVVGIFNLYCMTPD